MKFLTDPDDLVLDPFAGSNTTGEAAEALGRRWVAVEMTEEYIQGSKGRFLKQQDEPVRQEGRSRWEQMELLPD